MNKPNIQTTKQVVPMLYGYSTPEVVRHNGWTKIGYTEQDVETRINHRHTLLISDGSLNGKAMLPLMMVLERHL